jgi:hypothetical protein
MLTKIAIVDADVAPTYEPANPDPLKLRIDEPQA